MVMQTRMYRTLLQQAGQLRGGELALFGMAGRGCLLPSSHPQPAAENDLASQLFTQQPPTAATFVGQRLPGQPMVPRHTPSAEWWRVAGGAAGGAWRVAHGGSGSCQLNCESCQQHFRPRDLAANLLGTAELITELHKGLTGGSISLGEHFQEVEGGWVEQETASDPEDDGPEAPERHHQRVVEALQQKGLDAALEVMASHLKQCHPALFAPSPPFPSDHHTATSCTACEAAQRYDGMAAPVLSAVQRYLYRDMRLRHEPIEWLYDGLDPLLPAAALAQGKGAPMTLALLACMLLDRLGVAAIPIRATSTDRASKAAPAAGALALGGLMAHPTAPAATSYQPTDSWLVAVVHHTAQHHEPCEKNVGPSAPQQQQQCEPAGRGSGGGDGGAGGWRLSGVFLDVSVRGGAVLGEELLKQRYPQALEACQGTALVSVNGYRKLCSDWMRALLTACQRRGESDLGAHWLVQLLALDPAAPEWALVQQQQQQKLQHPIPSGPSYGLVQRRGL